MKGFNNDVRRFSACAKHLAVYCLALCLLGHLSLANSADLGPTFNWLTNQVTSPGVSSYTYAGASRALATGTPTIVTDGTNRALVTMATSARNPALVPYTVNVAGRLSPGLAAKYLARAIPVVGTLSTGYAIYDLIKEAGFDANRAPDGSLIVTKSDPSICTVAPCYAYNANAVGFSGSYTTLASACQAYKSTVPTSTQSAQLGGIITTVVGPYNTNQCQFVLNDGRTVYPIIVTRVSAPPSSPQYQASTMQELEDAIAAKSGWPTSSNYARAIVQAQEALKEPLPIDRTTLTTSGPATTQGGTKTVNNPDGTKSVTTTTYGHTYNTNNVTTTTNNVTNNYNASNVITSTTTETATPAPTQETQTDCDKYPDSNACRKDEFDIPTDEIPKKTITVTWAAENLGFGGGKCIDAQSIHTALGTTTLNFTSYCAMIETWVKPLVIAFSLLAAFFIVAPVKTET